MLRLVGGASVANPVADEEEESSEAEGDAETVVVVQDVERDGRDDDEGEEKGNGEPVDGGFGHGEVCCSIGGDGSIGEPLEMMLVIYT